MEISNGRLIDLTHLLLLAGEGPERIAVALQGLVAPAQAKDTLNQGAGGASAVQSLMLDTANRIHERHETIRQIVAALYRLHPTTERLLLREAELAIQTGIRAEGRDREEHFKDAFGLLRRVLDNPVSGRDYTLRFNLGWLAWQLGYPLAEVEEAFYQAARLSASTAAPFHEYSLQHLGYLQYLRDNSEAALETVTKGLSRYPESLDLAYDAARYAAQLDKTDEALNYLEACFNSNLIYLLLASSEEDFERSGTGTPALIAASVERSRRDLERALRAWRGALRLAREAEARGEITLELPGIDEAAQTAAEEQHAILSRRDPLGVAALYRATSTKPQEVLARAESEFTRQIAAKRAEATRLHRQLQKLLDDLELWNASLQQLEEEARVRGYVLRSDTSLPGMIFSAKKQQLVQTARISYINCLQNLDSAERHYAEQSPALQQAMTRINEDHDRLAEALAYLKKHSEGEVTEVAEAPAAE